MKSENSDDSKPILTGVVIPLVSALVGAIVGGLITLYASTEVMKTAFENEQKTKQLEQKQALTAYYHAIYSEIKAARVWFKKIGEGIEATNDGDVYNIYYASYNTPTLIYSCNIPLLLQINDARLRESILATYNGLQVLHNVLLYNNMLLENGDRTYNQPALYDTNLKRLRGLVPPLKTTYAATKNNIDSMLTILEEQFERDKKECLTSP